MPHDIVSTGEDKKYQAESDVRTMKEMIEIRNDPERLARATKEAVEEMRLIQGVIPALAELFPSMMPNRNRSFGEQINEGGGASGGIAPGGM